MFIINNPNVLFVEPWCDHVLYLTRVWLNIDYGQPMVKLKGQIGKSKMKRQIIIGLFQLTMVRDTQNVHARTGLVTWTMAVLTMVRDTGEPMLTKLWYYEMFIRNKHSQKNIASETKAGEKNKMY